jgi:hypothetical protein
MQQYTWQSPEEFRTLKMMMELFYQFARGGP